MIITGELEHESLKIGAAPIVRHFMKRLRLEEWEERPRQRQYHRREVSRFEGRGGLGPQVCRATRQRGPEVLYFRPWL